MENKINFLNSAITDTQDLIKFIETKTAFAITILISYIYVFFTLFKEIINYSNYFSCYFWCFLSAFIICLTICIITVVKIINPTNNPCNNIELDNKPIPKLKFFLAGNNYYNQFYPFYNSNNHKLSESYKVYYKSIVKINDKDIVKTLSFELLKVSFIRNIKNDRLNKLLLFLLLTTIFFIISYSIYCFEILKLLNHKKI